MLFKVSCFLDDVTRCHRVRGGSIQIAAGPIELKILIAVSCRSNDAIPNVHTEAVTKFELFLASGGFM